MGCWLHLSRSQSIIDGDKEPSNVSIMIGVIADELQLPVSYNWDISRKEKDTIK